MRIKSVPGAIGIIVCGSVLGTSAILLGFLLPAYNRDRDAAISDHLAGEIDRASSALDHQIQRALLLTRVMEFRLQATHKTYHEVCDEELARARLEARPDLTSGVTASIPDVSELSIYEMPDLTEEAYRHMHSVYQYGPMQEDLLTDLDTLGWDIHRFVNESALVGRRSADGALLLGVLMHFQAGARLYLYAMRVDIGKLQRDEVHSLMHIYLTDMRGNVFMSRIDKDITKAGFSFGVVASRIFDEHLVSGIFDDIVYSKIHPEAGLHALLAFRKLPFGDMLVIGVTPYSILFHEFLMTMSRALLLVVCLLLGAFGAAYIVGRYLMKNIRSIAYALEKMAHGSFSMRIAAPQNISSEDMQSDEIALLGSAFNSFADKMSELMSDALDRRDAQRKSSWEDITQEALLGSQEADTSNAVFSARRVLCGDYSGDFWYLRQTHGGVVFVFGAPASRDIHAIIDVTTVKIALDRLMLETKDELPSPSLIMKTIHEVIVGREGFRCLVIHFMHGRIRLANAGYTPPILYSQKKVHAAVVPHPFESLEIRDQGSIPLGLEMQDVPLLEQETGPGDILFVCGPGMFDLRDAQGESHAPKIVADSLQEIVAGTVQTALADDCEKRVRELLKQEKNSSSSSRDIFFCFLKTK